MRWRTRESADDDGDDVRSSCACAAGAGGAEQV